MDSIKTYFTIGPPRESAISVMLQKWAEVTVEIDLRSEHELGRQLQSFGEFLVEHYEEFKLIKEMLEKMEST